MIRRRFWAFPQNARGTSAVEFAILAGPFLLLIFGSIEFGRAMWTREALQATAIAGARCMGLVQNTCGTGSNYNSSMTTSYVQNVASTWKVVLPAAGITLNRNATCGGITNFSQISITYTFRTVVPTMLNSLSGGVPLSAVACFPNHA